MPLEARPPACAGINLRMNTVERAARALNRYHERPLWLAFPHPVVKNFGDDPAGGTAAQLAYDDVRFDGEDADEASQERRSAG